MEIWFWWNSDQFRALNFVNWSFCSKVIHFCVIFSRKWPKSEVFHFHGGLVCFFDSHIGFDQFPLVEKIQMKNVGGGINSEIWKEYIPLPVTQKILWRIQWLKENKTIPLVHIFLCHLLFYGLWFFPPPLRLAFDFLPQIFANLGFKLKIFFPFPYTCSLHNTWKLLRKVTSLGPNLWLL